MALARADGSMDRFYSMSSQIETEKKEYYRQLETPPTRRHGHHTVLAWFLGCLDRAIDRADGMLASATRKASSAVDQRPAV